ncbi:MAG TPA: non-canonical purine NTP pyrophosphatase [Chitinophagaceae bacterium]|nr:non-canonical purine NTP pyrophosphatase [Chitinophagaceae bacterium]
MKIYFVTSNTFKAAEVTAYFKEAAIQERFNIELCIVTASVQEILHADIEVIVKKKALEAYGYFGAPCLVEHGGIFMDALPGLPGGIGQIIWNAVGDRICSFLGEQDPRGAVAKSIVGYCDGKRVRTYTGETRGQITKAARGGYKFNWDPIFIPDGSDLTYGEMGPEKKQATSQSLKAWKAFLKAEFNSDLH